jgi:hypothetical protein
MRMNLFGNGAIRALLLITPIAIVTACGGGGDTAPPPPPDVGVAQPVRRDVTVFSEHLGTTEAFESVRA